ncbi:tRNA (adenosine(37)-N6)-threonylcarbamoyltransferase complex dimerization subunit type 1 TsaB [Mycetocola tolaasinivorans]|uniref:tRNA (Adenosine(37)-N6)-threonylcarbamoyltransferase complex dimerization subunit type 1 TsaB n=1 Tax=Mycetocola tolaasinivorans TaxID=76635 RepID=A0A3L7AD02_9MICO|nr:tRNA (adenosine(37)-N6)-threonylcarbamoyltransferase complex dimerization subunit type 1 TsaB [Mycetocola tolaasinivorans]RLP77252.1 tRNA (adenosine(37)-N6)-threonylcarbamoyltransferase complex dimerization subunit type 1 TsaB [Mycetocola tolaasinivorans]
MYLAIDTSTGTGVALVSANGEIRASRVLTDTRRHVEVVGTFIQEVLAETGTTAAQISAVAAGMGPGPFTGLRIGIAAARAFGQGANIPVIPLVSHDALALEWYENGGTGELLVTTDARRRELYWSRYSGLDAAGIPVREAGPALARPEDLDIAETERLGTAGTAPHRVDAVGIPAGSLGILAQRVRAAGRPGAEDEALYLRPPDIAAQGPRKRVS